MVAIKDMEMPKCCHWDCLLCNEDGGECMLGSHDTKTDTYKERAKDCPLVEIGTCKDCKHFHNVRKDFNTCDLWTIACADNHYCADFEKRGSENEVD